MITGLITSSIDQKNIMSDAGTAVHKIISVARNNEISNAIIKSILLVRENLSRSNTKVEMSRVRITTGT